MILVGNVASEGKEESKQSLAQTEESRESLKGPVRVVTKHFVETGSKRGHTIRRSMHRTAHRQKHSSFTFLT